MTFLGISSLHQLVCLTSQEGESPQGHASGCTVSWAYVPGMGPPHPAVSKASSPTAWLR